MFINIVFFIVALIALIFVSKLEGSFIYLYIGLPILLVFILLLSSYDIVKDYESDAPLFLRTNKEKEESVNFENLKIKDGKIEFYDKDLKAEIENKNNKFIYSENVKDPEIVRNVKYNFKSIFFKLDENKEIVKYYITLPK